MATETTEDAWRTLFDVSGIAAAMDRVPPTGSSSDLPA